MTNQTIVQPDGAIAGSGDTEGKPVKVVTPIYNAEYYQFSINAFGWYNLDMLLQEKNGVEMSELRVKVNVPFHINISLVIPSNKTFAEGGFLEGGKDIGFYNQNGEIPLPQQTVAYIIAMGEQNGILYFGKQSFVTSLRQTISLDIHEADRETMIQAVESLQLDSVNVKIEKAKNFDSIKMIDEEIKRYSSRCNCMNDTDMRPPISVNFP